jgi:uncharacterized OB-fold protein
VVPAVALETGDRQNSFLESKQFNKKCVRLVIPGRSYSWATSYFKQKGFKQYSDNILAVLKLQHPSSAETETATSQQYSSN